MNREPISNIIKRFREKNDWSQEALARKVGVSLQTVYRWENGTVKPSPLASEKLKQLGANI